MQRHTNMWRAMASADALKLGTTLVWAPLSDSYARLKAQERAARFGSRYWHHRYLRIRRIRRDTRHLRLQTQHYAHWTHPNQQYAWSWTPRSWDPAEAKLQHRGAYGADLFWRHRLRHLVSPSAGQTIHMICTYWHCSSAVVTRCELHPGAESCPRPVAVSWCESGLRHDAYNPSGAEGDYQMQLWARHQYGVSDGFNAGENIHGAYEYYLDAGWGPWVSSEYCWARSLL